MINSIKNLLRKSPRMFDVAKSCHTWVAKKDADWRFFDAFSKSHGRKVNFLYIGANDGLRSDPIRYFIARDQWQGVLVEPLPDVFMSLQSNFAYLKKRSKLVFVNAAISSANASHLSFWTFDEAFLNTLDREEKMNYLRKSSFDKEHALRFLRLAKLSDALLKEIQVPSLTLGELVKTHWDGPPIDLLVMDAEGHEASIIPSIDFQVLSPEAIYFESHNLGPKKTEVYSFLSRHGYDVQEIRGDALAVRKAVSRPRGV